MSTRVLGVAGGPSQLAVVPSTRGAAREGYRLRSGWAVASPEICSGGWGGTWMSFDSSLSNCL